jgi:hypothetical protein
MPDTLIKKGKKFPSNLFALGCQKLLKNQNRNRKIEKSENWKLRTGKPGTRFRFLKTKNQVPEPGTRFLVPGFYRDTGNR